jgi:hypothetical protein
LRGKIAVGHLRAYSEDREPLAVEHREGLRAVAAVVGLALDAAHARELAAQRAAHESAVQIASEALGTILDERELYRTVLVGLWKTKRTEVRFGALLNGCGTQRLELARV